MGYNRCPLFIMLTEQRFCAVSFIKINYDQNLVISRSLLVISFNPKNLESHLAIPLPITKYKNTYVVSL